jgi:hypothetical protein
MIFEVTGDPASQKDRLIVFLVILKSLFEYAGKML